ncbi:MAG: beta-galactosidase GalB [Acidobacteriota bacterium]
MIRTFVLAACLFALTALCLSQSNGPRERASFNDGWLFQKDDPLGAEEKLTYQNIKRWVIPTGNEFVSVSKRVPMLSGNVGEDVSYTRGDYDDSKWRRLNLPHDWAIEGDFIQEVPGGSGKRPWAGVGWYRKHFSVASAEKGKQFYLDLDGAMAYPAIWLNGKFVGGWAYGYQSFRVDLTPYLEYGKENAVSIRLENPPQSSRWYPGSGIYRNVWLVKTSAVHVGHWGTYITTSNFSSGSADLNIKVAIDNDLATVANVQVRTTLYDQSRKAVGSTVTSLDVSSSASQVFEQKLKIASPSPWSIESPDLYTAVVQILQKGKVVDTYETAFGIRTIKFDAQKGFFLNGQHVYLKGVCDHHDLGALGTAINTRAIERQLEILKQMGVNAIRTSHNPPAPELLDLADRMGFLVMDEAFDAWHEKKEPNDYHIAFDDWHERDWRAQLRRDRNHPSVILWSIGNEISEQGNAEGHNIAAELAVIAHDEDPTRPVTAAANWGNAGYNGFQKTVDVFGYNYRWKEYGKFHSDNPDQPLFGSETASAVSTRGEYFFPVSDDKLKGRKDFQVSSYDLYAPPWAWPPDTEFEADDKNPFVAGEFVWTGFDYLGEPTPYDLDPKTAVEFTDPARQAAADKELKETGKILAPSRSSYFGIVDLCGFPKDRFYIYQARWRPDLPMAHILPHWNWPERVGQVTPVHVYTSGDEAELFLNGRSLGRKKRGRFEYRLRWDDVVYQPGELKVVAYKNGGKWVEDVVKTTGESSQIVLNADRSTINADGSDLSYITVKIADKNGLMVPRTHNRLSFRISGPGQIVAVDNGDPTDHESFQSTSRRAYNGLALVIVRSIKGNTGKIILRATSDTLRADTVSISSTR